MSIKEPLFYSWNSEILLSNPHNKLAKCVLLYPFYR